jgi:hypothetical protein
MSDHWLAIFGVILGVAAMVMAAPPLFQMFFGRPRLRFEADDFTGPDGRILVIAIKNPPVRNRILRFLGVEREYGDVIAFFDIQELGTGRIVANSVRGQMQTVHLRELGLQGRSMPGFTVGLTVVATRNGQATIVSGNSEEMKDLPLGFYVARISIFRGQDIYRIGQKFRVDATDHKTIWDVRNVVSIRQ